MSIASHMQCCSVLWCVAVPKGFVAQCGNQQPISVTGDTQHTVQRALLASMPWRRHPMRRGHANKALGMTCRPSPTNGLELLYGSKQLAEVRTAHKHTQ